MNFDLCVAFLVAVTFGVGWAFGRWIEQNQWIVSAHSSYMRTHRAAGGFYVVMTESAFYETYQLKTRSGGEPAENQDQR